MSGFSKRGQWSYSDLPDLRNRAPSAQAAWAAATVLLDPVPSRR